MLELVKELKKYGDVKCGKELKKFTTFRIGGLAEFVVEVAETDKLIALLNYLSGEGIDYFILGGGSNILMPDEGFSGVVIRVKTNHIKVGKTKIIADAGVLLGAVVGEASKNSLTGLEWAVGIPGTVGGAVRGNAGAMGLDTGKNIEAVVVWKDGEVLTFTNSDCGFSYRSSVFKREGGVVLSSTFILAPGESAQIAKKIQECLTGRLGKFPSEPSAGSFFQNIKKWSGELPEGLPQIHRERGVVPAGWLIEQCGLKGYRIGDAGISEIHGNFIVNYGNASARDVQKLVDEVKEKVYNKYGVDLIPEVEIIH
ncbi:MAG: UDP-N-acetylmuramate dehydrogenase [Patescibacteria group bacterium]